MSPGSQVAPRGTKRKSQKNSSVKSGKQTVAKRRKAHEGNGSKEQEQVADPTEWRDDVESNELDHSGPFFQELKNIYTKLTKDPRWMGRFPEEGTSFDLTPADIAVLKNTVYTPFAAAEKAEKKRRNIKSDGYWTSKELLLRSSVKVLFLHAPASLPRFLFLVGLIAGGSKEAFSMALMDGILYRLLEGKDFRSVRGILFLCDQLIAKPSLKYHLSLPCVWQKLYRDFLKHYQCSWDAFEELWKAKLPCFHIMGLPIASVCELGERIIQGHADLSPDFRSELKTWMQTELRAVFWPHVKDFRTMAKFKIADYEIEKFATACIKRAVKDKASSFGLGMLVWELFSQEVKKGRSRKSCLSRVSGPLVVFVFIALSGTPEEKSWKDLVESNLFFRHSTYVTPDCVWRAMHKALTQDYVSPERFQASFLEYALTTPFFENHLLSFDGLVYISLFIAEAEDQVRAIEHFWPVVEERYKKINEAWHWTNVWNLLLKQAREQRTSFRSLVSELEYKAWKPFHFTSESSRHEEDRFRLHVVLLQELIKSTNWSDRSGVQRIRDILETDTWKSRPSPYGDTYFVSMMGIDSKWPAVMQAMLHACSPEMFWGKLGPFALFNRYLCCYSDDVRPRREGAAVSDVVPPDHVRQWITSHLETLKEAISKPHPYRPSASSRIVVVSLLVARLALMFGELSGYRSLLESVSEVSPRLLEKEKQQLPELWTPDRNLSPRLHKSLQEHQEMMRVFSLRRSFLNKLALRQEIATPEWLELLPRYIEALEGERHIDPRQTECPIAFTTFEPGETTIVCRTCLCQFGVESLFRWFMQKIRSPEPWRLRLTPYDERLGGSECPHCRTQTFGNFAKSTYALPASEV
uniref:RING-type domain-containing protein n=1 Tax=Palpitomonas bilix TaxID=652834 RepID=A0A7S3G6J8_9EUKA|mmetsp:Transcript_25683/g.64610  ORF Transcript_25683/g.64610 Transcript_25683/m.64610 type:complete len:864 (+) Transcript_25683:252-2843(+)|eukprot:CAMPEP_0113879290 /NCGR_PEP_ID=MMETSP0780_2-20120614/7159_1 /TAXON_ID=652834 /ORGANISM="Palpitomonas bilix" /LENGTH=863 /DNA_ID=CAMNT_0000865861 /DNA_START=259 /DNA_END=2850 /DNA_ORIENTATION=+ /assembly_acc=CAM_ASM_000599